MLSKNQQSPDFNVLDQDGTAVKVADFHGKKNIVLYFYPKDDTTGCTIEANQFTALADAFSKLDTVIIGVSKDSCESHRNFIKKYALNVILLSDESGEMCEQFAVWQEKEKKGIKKMGIVRSTFIIDKNSQLVSVEYGVTADGHAQAVLEKIKIL